MNRHSKTIFEPKVDYRPGAENPNRLLRHEEISTPAQEQQPGTQRRKANGQFDAGFDKPLSLGNRILQVGGTVAAIVIFANGLNAIENNPSAAAQEKADIKNQKEVATPSLTPDITQGYQHELDAKSKQVAPTVVYSLPKNNVQQHEQPKVSEKTVKTLGDNVMKTITGGIDNLLNGGKKAEDEHDTEKPADPTQSEQQILATEMDNNYPPEHLMKVMNAYKRAEAYVDSLAAKNGKEPDKFMNLETYHKYYVEQEKQGKDLNAGIPKDFMPDNPEESVPLTKTSIIYRFLRTNGLSKADSAAVTANIYGESGGRPDAIEKGTGQGRGMIQWTGGRRIELEKKAKELGYSPDDALFQLHFLLQEMQTTHKHAYDLMLQTEGVRQKAIDFCKHFEAPDLRGEKGKKILQYRADVAEALYKSNGVKVTLQN